MTYCKCHPGILSPLQESTLDPLRHWVSANGVENLSSRLTRGGKEAAFVYNQCNYHFGLSWPKKSRPADLQKLSSLGLACHFAGIEYRPSCLRSTTYEDDLQELLRLYDQGEVLTDTALTKSNHSKLFHRVKKRAGTSWSRVFLDLRKQRKDLEFRRFFGHSPRGLYVDSFGEVVVLGSQAEINAFAEKQFARYASTKASNMSLFDLLYEAPSEIFMLYVRLLDQKQNAREVFEKAAGRKFVERSEAGSWFGRRVVPSHLLAGEKHPSIGSLVEAAIDDLLFDLVPDYENRHQHNVFLNKLLPDLCFEGTPYVRSPIVDIVIDKRVVVEVSFETEVITDDYEERMDWKLSMLKKAGLSAYNAKREFGVPDMSRVVRSVLKDLGIEREAEEVLPLLEAKLKRTFKVA